MSNLYKIRLFRTERALARPERHNLPTICRQLRLWGVLAFFAASRALAQSESNPASPPADSSSASNRVPDLVALVASFHQNEMRAVAQRYQADRGNLNRYYNVALSPLHYTRFKLFYTGWLAALQKIDPARFSEDGRAEHARLVENIRLELQQLDKQARAQAEIAPLVPFEKTILDLDESRRRMERADPEKAAATVENLAKSVAEIHHSLEHQPGVDSGNAALKLTPPLAKRAADTVTTLRTALKTWYDFYNDYDPLFTWWMAQPQKDADQALDDYLAFLHRQAGPDGAGDTVESAASALPAPLPEAPVNLAGKTPQVPDLDELISTPVSRMRPVIEKFPGNRGGRGSAGRGGRGQPPGPEYYQAWLAALRKLDFEKLNHDEQVDYVLLRNRVEYQLQRSAFRNDPAEDTAAFIPFEAEITKLNEAQNQREKIDAAKAGEFLQVLKKEIDDARRAATNELEKGAAAATGAGRAARSIAGLRDDLQEWRDRNIPDWPADQAPVAAFKLVDQALEEYAAFLRDKSGSAARPDGSDIVGRPLGRDMLNVEIAGEMIPYTPEELISIAEKEFAWCVAEMQKASADMGCGQDWRRAVEQVKNLHAPVGGQPYLIRDLAWEAVDYLEKNDLVTIPEVARETWRMQMMSLQRQAVNPFFTGGETISVSYPLSEMSHDAKLQSMRGNNIPFARATVFHELIPGHELQGFIAARYHTERGPFNTPFYLEGWAVYWEMLLYERGFDRTPEERIGALFWRLHRCARIVFSLEFHLKEWTPRQCIDYLVTDVGHERDNATAEVRRSFGTGYSPLYQAAYLLGALQLRELHRELTGPGKMTDRAFHDAVLEEGSMPIAMLRASLTNQKLTPDYRPEWRFYDSTPATTRAEKP